MSLKKLVPTVLFTLALAGCSGSSQPEILRGKAEPQGCPSAQQTQGLRGVAEPPQSGLQGIASPQNCTQAAHAPEPQGLVGVVRAMP
ncbi:MAG: hypothetical protein AB4911_21570 [Oscillochloridaceae bacterium umkhey_bin13]